jgi:hypothetical protein
MPGLIRHLKIHHKSNHVSRSATHTKAKRNRNTNTQSEFSKLNVTQSQKALNLSNEEWMCEPIVLPFYLYNSVTLAFTHHSVSFISRNWLQIIIPSYCCLFLVLSWKNVLDL